jgi:hypothetical protein
MVTNPFLLKIIRDNTLYCNLLSHNVNVNCTSLLSHIKGQKPALLYNKNSNKTFLRNVGRHTRLDDVTFNRTVITTALWNPQILLNYLVQSGNSARYSTLNKAAVCSYETYVNIKQITRHNIQKTSAFIVTDSQIQLDVLYGRSVYILLAWRWRQHGPP